MNKQIKLAPSILSANFSILKNEIDSVNVADYLHIDVMDGNFVPNISLGVPVIKSIRAISDIFFDVHLMIDNPQRYVEKFVLAGADIISVHFEACENLNETLNLIKSFGKKVSVAVKPNTDIKCVYDFLEKVDMILIMSVEPGFGGQELISHTLEKARTLSKFATKNNIQIDIEMDGGINLENVGQVLDAGVNVIVAGSSIFNFADRNQKINEFKKKFMQYKNQLQIKRND